MSFVISFGLTEIVDHSLHFDQSIVQHFVQSIHFNFVEVELSNGSLCLESLVEHVNNYVTPPLEIPRIHTVTRKIVARHYFRTTRTRRFILTRTVYISIA